MKSVVTEAVNKAAKSEYPCLKKWNNTSCVVLFSGPRKGICIVSDAYTKVGDTNDDFAETAFSPFTGTVTLSND